MSFPFGTTHQFPNTNGKAPTSLAASSLPAGLVKSFIEQGVSSSLQLKELIDLHPQRAAKLSCMSISDLRSCVEDHLGKIPDFQSNAMQSFAPPPAAGVANKLPTGFTAQGFGGGALDDHLKTIQNIPTSFSLTDVMQPVSSQGPYPYCVAYAADATLECVWGESYSDTYLYPASRAEPGFPDWATDGSWLYFAFTHAYKKGHVPLEAYTFEDCVQHKQIEHLASLAYQSRADGFSSLLHCLKDPSLLDKLFRSIISGTFDPRIPPLPIPVSLLLYRSFQSYATAREGLIPLPLPNEETAGGHAMVVVGYVDAQDPANPFGIDYFLVRNSWGRDWAAENPFGHPGHAMIPAAYFTPERTIEAYLCLA